MPMLQSKGETCMVKKPAHVKPTIPKPRVLNRVKGIIKRPRFGRQPLHKF